ncbi:hypothetical protein GC096_30685 [Paenibacillus sp. LMG 31461]|uniref:Uncharacterized protein n=1 Tax=Paenibacillus plantarum TaxID=2654975 RepID=A0ABX1XIP9_9BACL|nr:hypothetical protein [Paenibacillus plantarum]NOU68397.1 hypothetical protein [Paenibacillus plantarum]
MSYAFPTDVNGKAGAVIPTTDGNKFFVPVVLFNSVMSELPFGLVAKEPFSGTTNMTKTFTTPMMGFVISNDGMADLSFSIETDMYKVKAGEVFEEYFKPFTVVSIVATGAFRAYGRGRA